jgi:hypothetical protein
MKTLVKITNIENGIIFYSEINRRTGAVMIEDQMSEAQFKRAINLPTFGFTVIQTGWIPEDIEDQIIEASKTKAKTIKLIEKFSGQTVDSYHWYNKIKIVEINLIGDATNGMMFEARTKITLLNRVYNHYFK